MASRPFTASAAISRPPESKSKPSTRPPVLANTSCAEPSGFMRTMLPLAIAAVELAVAAEHDVLRPDSVPSGIRVSPASLSLVACGPA
jgi:hypothetical protein